MSISPIHTVMPVTRDPYFVGASQSANQKDSRGNNGGFGPASDRAEEEEASEPEAEELFSGEDSEEDASFKEDPTETELAKLDDELLLDLPLVSHPRTGFILSTQPPKSTLDLHV